MTTMIPDRSRAATTPDCELGVENFRDHQEWILRTKCRGTDPDKLFVRSAVQRETAAICHHCPVVPQCRTNVLDNCVEFDVWGGLTERQCCAMLYEHPEITSWADPYAEQYAAQRKTKLAK